MLAGIQLRLNSIFRTMLAISGDPNIALKHVSPIVHKRHWSIKQQNLKTTRRMARECGREGYVEEGVRSKRCV